MASYLPPQPVPSGLLHEEGFRIAGAIVALLAAGLVLLGGLLWREHSRAEAQVVSPPTDSEHPR